MAGLLGVAAALVSACGGSSSRTARSSTANYRAACLGFLLHKAQLYPSLGSRGSSRCVVAAVRKYLPGATVDAPNAPGQQTRGSLRTSRIDGWRLHLDRCPWSWLFEPRRSSARQGKGQERSRGYRGMTAWSITTTSATTLRSTARPLAWLRRPGIRGATGVRDTADSSNNRISDQGVRTRTTTPAPLRRRHHSIARSADQLGNAAQRHAAGHESTPGWDNPTAQTEMQRHSDGQRGATRLPFPA